MKTEISRFCTVCSESLGTLPSALDAAAAQLEGTGPKLQPALVALNELRARLRSLTDKLRSQQAYLLIFGPLKSGKSTLMNAISGAYVSEVTSLPGYPCLVFVQHSPQEKFSVTRYNGRESGYPSAAALNDSVLDAHLALAREIRSSEQRHETFDPRTDYPEAIRRIDIQLPVAALAESATVLVDTPGLYSRMNFGYDVLTREFRDSAACAVFVVKTDNLFLEQVFAEFNQLLGLFSRIFIVVNVDASKRDLTPDGSLQPSAESRSPERIVEAFTTLSMAGPLREAYESGRVRIHAVDLLGAASEFLSGTPAETPHRPAFDAFIRDLTEYLNSSDYTREFIRDSLRQARTICEESRGVVSGEAMAKLRESQETLVTEIRDLDARLAATERLLQVSWTQLFQGFLDEHARGGEDETRLRTAQVREDLRQALNRWFVGNDSLSALSQLHWNPILTDAARSLAEASRDRLQRLANRGYAGLNPTTEVLGDLQTAGFSPAGGVQRALGAATTEEDVAGYKAAIDPDRIPVRKSFLDWLLFRGMGKVRRRLFGEDQSLQIPAEEKAKRLREESRAEFERFLEETVQARFPARPAKFASDLATAYVQKAAEEIVQALKLQRDQFAKERAARKVPFERQAKIIATMAELDAQAERVAGDIDLLAEQEAAKAAAPIEAPASTDPGYLPQVALLPLLT
jgi:energy-coupling factor transporter ATP-binding protein EcfA2